MTIKDIAKLSGYAVGTVSRVLNDRPDVSPAARAKVLSVVEEQHFRLNNNAKHLKQLSSSGIAIIVKGRSNLLFAAIVERMQVLIREKGYPSFIYYLDEADDELEQALEVSRERKPLGILFLGSNLDYFKAWFPAITVPCVLVTNSAESLGFQNLSSVCTDDEAAAACAVEHLLALGHTHIGILGGKMETSDAACARFQGCLHAFDAAKIPFDRDSQYEMTRFTMGGGYDGMGRLLAKMPGLTAVFAMSDVQAVGAIRAIRDKGLEVPGDISVIGFDGIELGSYISPALTTIRQDALHMADRGIEILFGHIAARQDPIHQRVPFTLLPGESVRALSAPKKG
ncbi:MAG: LacI family DNA-binding transcriptional regulator [Oscillospiraceae bacterium]